MHEVRQFDVDGYEITDPSNAYLGEGTYGTVFQATQTETGHDVAIKRHHFVAHEKGIPASVLRETTLLKLLYNSPYVVRLHDVVHVGPSRGSTPPTSYMIFERMDYDLNSYATQYRPLAPDAIQRIMYHVLLGIHHCHVMGLMHRDLKPHNILINAKNRQLPNAKLADFGFGRSFGLPIRQLTEEVITLWYRPPEVLLGYQGHSPAIDIWSAACILSELHENVVLFKGNSQIDQLNKIFHLVGTPDYQVWGGLRSCAHWHEYPDFPSGNFRDAMPGTPISAINLLSQMLMVDPAQRPTAEACLRHPYFASVFDEQDLKLPPLELSDLLGAQTEMARPNSNPAVMPSHRRDPFSDVFDDHPHTY